MMIVTDLKELQLTQRSAVVIGKFDGVHKGHKALLKGIEKAGQEGCKKIVFSFSPSPAVYFGYSDGMKLTTDREKRMILEKNGVDILIEYPMTPETASISPEKFIEEILYRKLHAFLIAAGPDLSFGDRGSGNFALLERNAAKYGFQTLCIDKLCRNGQEISSSMIRSLVEKGKMEEARECLGEPYMVSGIVEHGARLGRTIGIPTANIIPESDKLLPPFGVYYSKVLVDGKELFGMTNIGRKPTVKDNKEVTVETYLYDFNEDVYGKDMQVQLWSFKRPEIKFASVEELKATMQKDIAEGRAYFNSINCV